MKDAKGHGSDPRGGAAHQAGVTQLGQPAKLLAKNQQFYSSGAPREKGEGAVLMPIDKVTPSENILPQTGGWNGVGEPPHTDNPVIASQIALVKSIRQAVLAGKPIEPLIVRPNGRLVEGHHRLLAFRGANVTHVPVLVRARGRTP